MRDYFNKMRGGKTCPARAPWHEILWSAIGSFLGILAVYVLGHLHELRLEDSLFLVGSFGATAVLIYGIPASPYAQPRNMIGGHVISAIIGVTCVTVITTSPAIVAAVAVALSLVAMHITRTVHPPGGATALIAVIGGESIHALGYWFVLTPVAFGAVLMLIVALLVNNISPHRRYPQYWF